MEFGEKVVLFRIMLCLFCRMAAVQTVNKGDEKMLQIILCDFLNRGVNDGSTCQTNGMEKNSNCRGDFFGSVAASHQRCSF